MELFSGIGAFSQAANSFSLDVRAAFDLNTQANEVYFHNHGLAPSPRNLDTICYEEIPEADIWWMSPPCTPYSRRGLQKDIVDNRAKGLSRLIELIPRHLPEFILLENVEHFESSRSFNALEQVLQKCAYRMNRFHICSTELGVPMRRPRFYLVASRTALLLEPPARAVAIKDKSPRLLDFIDLSSEQSHVDLVLPSKVLERYAPVLNIVDAEDENATLICFTRGYFTCRKASGSLLRMPNGVVRFFSPEEILKLLGFSSTFEFPGQISLKQRFRLLGNSVDVRAIKLLLSTLPCLANGKTPE